MKPRPRSVTVIAWFLLISGAISLISMLIGSATILRRPEVMALARRSPLPLSMQYIVMYMSVFMKIASAIGMLKARNWARFLYTGGQMLVFIVGIATSPTKVPMIPGIVLFVVISVLLFRPSANRYFAITCGAPFSPDADTIRTSVSSTENPMTRRTIGVVCYVFAGVFAYSACLLAFISQLPTAPKLAIMGIFCLLVTIIMIVGSVIARSVNWQRNAGIVLLSAAAYGAFGVFSMNAIAVSREFATVFPGNRLRFLCDYHTGVTCLIVMIAAGVLLLFGAKRATT